MFALKSPDIISVRPSAEYRGCLLLEFRGDVARLAIAEGGGDLLAVTLRPDQVSELLAAIGSARGGFKPAAESAHPPAR
jgi:hypothetical protein